MPLPLPKAVQDCLDQFCEAFIARVPWASDTNGAGAPGPSDADQPIVVFFDETCGVYSHVQFKDAPPHPIGWLSQDMYRKRVLQNLTWLIDQMTMGSYLTQLVSRLKASLFSVSTFAGGAPVCDPDGACLQFFQDSTSADADCPSGRVTHFCVKNGPVFCLGGSGGDGPPPDGATALVDCDGATFTPYDPVFPGGGYAPWCGPSPSALGGPRPAPGAFCTGAGLCDGDVDDDPASWGVNANFFGSWAHYTPVAVSGLTAGLQTCFDYSYSTTATSAQTRWVYLYDAAGNAVTPVSATNTNPGPVLGEIDGAAIGTDGVTECGAIGVGYVTPPNQPGQLCIDWGLLPDGDYTIKHVGMNSLCVSSLAATAT